VPRDTEHPDPQFERQEWLSLDGEWEFSFDCAAEAGEVEWNRRITVPYPPESELSGVADTSYHRVVWYRRAFDVPSDWNGRRLVLHFGAVDYRATVWVNDVLVARHEGGHTPFSADMTAALRPGRQTAVVRAEDDPEDMAMPRGKQDWLSESHHIWYPRTTGIWQTVWLEALPRTAIASLRMTPDLGRFAVDFEVGVDGDEDGLTLSLQLRLKDQLLCEDRYVVRGGAVSRSLVLDDPGIYSERNRILWTPENPVLLDVELVLCRGGEELDRVRSYTALREAAARDGHFQLNGRPYFLRLVLDQGYWRESHLAAPSDAALRHDVELAKALGFNGVRKHQKAECPRYLYWADRLGLLVWSEMPSAYSFSSAAAVRLVREWSEVIERDRNHPSVVVWVPLNESWGVPDMETSQRQRHLAHTLYHLSKTLDGTRPVVGNDGWEQPVGDLLTIHDYNRDPGVLRERYGTREHVLETVRTTRPQNRRIILGPFAADGAPAILSEFGGVRFAPGADGWGYDEAESPEVLLAKYAALVAAATSTALAGFCYTQFADTFQEQNGLLFEDRTPKAELSELARATRAGR
jgi:beta-galactosidase/beta-glucuronidase